MHSVSPACECVNEIVSVCELASQSVCVLLLFKAKACLAHFAGELLRESEIRTITVLFTQVSNHQILFIKCKKMIKDNIKDCRNDKLSYFHHYLKRNLILKKVQFKQEQKIFLSITFMQIPRRQIIT